MNKIPEPLLFFLIDIDIYPNISKLFFYLQVYSKILAVSHSLIQVEMHNTYPVWTG